LWSPISQPQHLLLVTLLQRNLFGESALIQVGITTLSWPLWGHRGAGRNHALDCAVMMLPSAALMILTLVAWGVFGVFATLADRGLDRLH